MKSSPARRQTCWAAFEQRLRLNPCHRPSGHAIHRTPVGGHAGRRAATSTGAALRAAGTCLARQAAQRTALVRRRDAPGGVRRGRRQGRPPLVPVGIPVTFGVALCARRIALGACCRGRARRRRALPSQLRSIPRLPEARTAASGDCAGLLLGPSAPRSAVAGQRPSRAASVGDAVGAADWPAAPHFHWRWRCSARLCQCAVPTDGCSPTREAAGSSRRTGSLA